LWGSCSFIVSAVCGGIVVGRFGAQSAILLMIAGAAMVVAAAHAQLRSEVRPQVRSEARSPESRGVRVTEHGLSIAKLATLLGSPAFLLLLLATGAVQAAHAVLYTFATLHWRTLGLSATAAGALWAVSIAAEIAIFAFARPIVARLKPANLSRRPLDGDGL
jgi:PPP family 3-phenylpropionic acid transporter